MPPCDVFQLAITAQKNDIEVLVWSESDVGAVMAQSCPLDLVARTNAKRYPKEPVSKNPSKILMVLTNYMSIAFRPIR